MVNISVPSLKTYARYSAEEAYKDAEAYRAQRTMLTDFLWQIRQEARVGGRVATLYCNRDAPGLEEAIGQLRIDGYTVTSVRDNVHTNLVCTRATW